MSRRRWMPEPNQWAERASRSLRESCEKSRLSELQRRLLAVLTADEIEELRQKCKDDPTALKLLEEVLPK